MDTITSELTLLIDINPFVELHEDTYDLVSFDRHVIIKIVEDAEMKGITVS